MKKEVMICEAIKKNSSVKIIKKCRSVLNSRMLIFDKPIRRGEREKVEKCLKKSEIKSLWGDLWLVTK